MFTTQLRHKKNDLLLTLANEYGRRGRPVETARLDKDGVIALAWPEIREHAMHLPVYIPTIANVPLPQGIAGIIAAAAALAPPPQPILPAAPGTAAPAAAAASAGPAVDAAAVPAPTFNLAFSQGTWTVTHVPTAYVIPLGPVDAEGQGYWQLTSDGQHLTQGPIFTPLNIHNMFARIPEFCDFDLLRHGITGKSNMYLCYCYCSVFCN